MNELQGLKVVSLRLGRLMNVCATLNIRKSITSDSDQEKILRFNGAVMALSMVLHECCGFSEDSPTVESVKALGEIQGALMKAVADVFASHAKDGSGILLREDRG
jgi:hypothetical protein